MCNMLGQLTTTFLADIMSPIRLQVARCLFLFLSSLRTASQNIMQVTVISWPGYRLSRSQSPAILNLIHHRRRHHLILNELPRGAAVAVAVAITASGRACPWIPTPLALALSLSHSRGRSQPVDSAASAYPDDT